MAFLIKNNIMAVPAFIFQAENGSIKIGSPGLLIVNIADDTDMVILNDREIAVPLIKITGFGVQVKHKESAAAKGFIGSNEN